MPMVEVSNGGTEIYEGSASAGYWTTSISTTFAGNFQYVRGGLGGFYYRTNASETALSCSLSISSSGNSSTVTASFSEGLLGGYIYFVAYNK